MLFAKSSEISDMRVTLPSVVAVSRQQPASEQYQQSLVSEVRDSGLTYLLNSSYMIVVCGLLVV